MKPIYRLLNSPRFEYFTAFMVTERTKMLTTSPRSCSVLLFIVESQAGRKRQSFPVLNLGFFYSISDNRTRNKQLNLTLEWVNN